MDALQAMLTRHAVREFEPGRIVSEKELERILQAALQAPSARDTRPVHLVVVHDRSALDALAQRLPYAKMCASAPLAILVCGEEAKTKMDFIATDCSAAAMSILLAAHAQGLGGVWTAVHPDPARVEAVRAILGVPEGIVPFALLPIGHPSAAARAAGPKQKFDPTRIHSERW